MQPQVHVLSVVRRLFFFFNDTATTEIYTLSLHDALPICALWARQTECLRHGSGSIALSLDRKSTRLNSSHLVISYAVFCLKKKIISQDEAAPCVTFTAGDTHDLVEPTR